MDVQRGHRDILCKESRDFPKAAGKSADRSVEAAARGHRPGRCHDGDEEGGVLEGIDHRREGRNPEHLYAEHDRVERDAVPTGDGRLPSICVLESDVEALVVVHYADAAQALHGRQSSGGAPGAAVDRSGNPDAASRAAPDDIDFSIQWRKTQDGVHARRHDDAGRGLEGVRCEGRAPVTRSSRAASGVTQATQRRHPPADCRTSFSRLDDGDGRGGRLRVGEDAGFIAPCHANL